MWCELIIYVQFAVDNDYGMTYVILIEVDKIFVVCLCIQISIAFKVVLPRGVGLTIALYLGSY